MENEWLDIGPLTVVSGRLAVIDPTLFDGEVVDLNPGTYRVQAQVEDRAGDRRISRLRVTAGNNVCRGEEIGTVGVDFAQVGVGDWEAVSCAAESLDKTGEEVVLAALDTPELFGIIPWNRNDAVIMPWVRSGYGDGRYPIFELLTGGIRVGVEIVFIDTDDN